MDVSILTSSGHRRSALVAGSVAAAAILYAAFYAYARPETKGADRGIRFDHDVHVATLEMDCSDCHRTRAGESWRPDHRICGVCHEVEAASAATPKADSNSCATCHTRPDYTVGPIAGRFTDELKWSHDPHLNAAVDCRKCHQDPDDRPLPKGDLMQFCMDCHRNVSIEMNECAICHNERRQDTVPMFRDGARIQHDNTALWQRTHGSEYKMDPKFCATCHQNHEQDCETCHRLEKPNSHTIAFRNRTHGLQASWDRSNCAVCHEEVSCIKCHQNTQPASHRRAGWDRPADRHCVSCHFPQQENNCAVCHEQIEHSTAPGSIHNLGVFPANCARCHPGGNPFRAPHPVNSSAQCLVCHSR